MKEIFKIWNVLTIISSILSLICLLIWTFILLVLASELPETAKFIGMPSLVEHLKLPLVFLITIASIVGTISLLISAKAGQKENYEVCIKARFVLLAMLIVSYLIIAIISGSYFVVICVVLVPVLLMQIFIETTYIYLAKIIETEEKKYMKTLFKVWSILIMIANIILLLLLIVGSIGLFALNSGAVDMLPFIISLIPSLIGCAAAVIAAISGLRGDYDKCVKFGIVLLFMNIIQVIITAVFESGSLSGVSVTPIIAAVGYISLAKKQD